MVRWTVYVVILMLCNVNCYIEGGLRRQSTVCPKELNAFSVLQTDSNASSDSTRICSSALGCCNKSIENAMKTQINKTVKFLVHDRNEKVKKKFKIVHDSLKAFSENVLQQTSESAIKYLRTQPTPWRDIASHVTPHIRTLFADLQKYLTHKDLNIKDSTNTFFKNFFLPLYKNVIRYTKELPSGFKECLKDKMHLIKPFKNVPQDITAMLEKDLSSVRVLLEGLQTAMQVLQITKDIELSGNCTNNLVKMVHCPLCNGLKNSKPCLDDCLNITSRCLKPYLNTNIHQHWDVLITSMNELSVLLSKSLDAITLFQELQKKISNSRSHVVLSPPKVHHYCGNISQWDRNSIPKLNNKPKNPPIRDVGNSDLYMAGDTQSSIFANLPTRNDADDQLNLVRKNLSDTRMYFNEFPRSLCSNGGLAAPENVKNDCWNGSGLGRYNRSLTVLEDMKPVNSELLTEAASNLLQTANIEIKKILLWSEAKEPSLSGDGSGSGSGTDDSWSGDDNEIPGGSADCMDDEDCGSGQSGQGTDDDVLGDQPYTKIDLTSTAPTSRFATGGSRTNTYQWTLILLCLLPCFLLSR